MEWTAIVQGWNEVLKSVMALENRWELLSTQHQREEEEEKQDPGTKLRLTAAKALAGMIGCWAAQWVWWIGYIRRMGDSYCPPNLTEMGVIWTVFSAFGARELMLALDCFFCLRRQRLAPSSRVLENALGSFKD